MTIKQLTVGSAFTAGSILISPLCHLAEARDLPPGWIADTKTGCKVWDPNPQPNESVIWSGGCEGGFQSGHGVEQWFIEGKVGIRLEGIIQNGKFIGDVTATYPNGSEYVGQLETGHGYKNGQGTYTYVNGNKYVGGWKDDKREGQGTVYSNQGLVVSSGLWSADVLLETDVPLVQEGGVLKVPVIINGSLALNFIIDSGASDVSIPADVILVMMRTGKLSKSDFIGTKIYTLADGSTFPSTTFRIRSLKVGGRVITNVVGSMADVKGDLLLGQSFLSRFKRWSINNGRRVLELE